MTLPLTYFNTLVGHALVDKGLDFPPVQWKLMLPATFRRASDHTPDVILAMLREDESLLHNCHPYITLYGFRQYHARLFRFVLRPQVIPLLKDAMTKKHQRKEILINEITRTLMTCQRTVHLNQNKTDCRLANLRELSLSQDDMPPSLIHEDL